MLVFEIRVYDPGYRVSISSSSEHHGLRFEMYLQ